MDRITCFRWLGRHVLLLEPARKVKGGTIVRVTTHSFDSPAIDVALRMEDGSVPCSNLMIGHIATGTTRASVRIDRYAYCKALALEELVYP